MGHAITIDSDELRRLAVQRHVRLVAGGLEAPNGGSCKICHGEWDEGQPEHHALTCPLFREE